VLVVEMAMGADVDMGGVLRVNMEDGVRCMACDVQGLDMLGSLE
jgi:hypothetical protein